MHVQNALTIDVEDWYHVCGTPQASVCSSMERRVRYAVELLLEIFNTAGVKATFFVLGTVAREDPGIVPMIAREGHEIASHGWSHQLVTRLSETEFRDEVRRTAAILEAQGGKKPEGFRAPQWSLSSADTPWAFSILKEEGCRYDSSLNPLPFIGERAGKRQPHVVTTAAGNLLEFPPLVLPTILGNMPVGGGWGFRFFPMSMVRNAIRDMNRNGSPAILYVHPREVDPESPRLQLSRIKSFAAYGPKRDAVPRLLELLKQFPFTTLERLVNQWHSA